VTANVILSVLAVDYPSREGERRDSALGICVWSSPKP